MSEIATGKQRNYDRHGVQTKSKAKIIDDSDNYILQAFKCYREELDAKHDRYERIVKINRDINIESKRVIFLLHSIDGRKSNRAKVLEEAEQRLGKLITVNFCSIAKELQHQDIYKYRGAYSGGLQEFVEAYSYMEYIKYAIESVNSKKQMSDWLKLQARMCYDEKQTTPDIVAVDTADKYSFIVEPTEYILGIADLTGELMRRCVTSLGSGETNICVNTCQALQYFYRSYLSLRIPRNRELSRKINAMRHSVLKAENICYNIKVRGGEAAKWGSVFEKPNDDDEGYF